MESDLATLMAHNSVLALLKEGQQVAIQRALHRSIPRGAYLSFAGDAWSYLFIVSSGQIDGVKESDEGRQLIVISLQPGEIFWGLSFFNEGAANPVSLYATVDSEVFIWSRADILPLLIEVPSALWQLTRQMTRYMEQASQIIEGLAFQPVAGRLAKLLLDQFGSTGQPYLSRDMTLDQLAAKIGTTREQVCRALYQFSDRELIHITRTEFTLINEDGLAALAGAS